jgi:hypothetical protein
MYAVILALLACTPFPDKYENIVEGQKMRPFGIVCEPPEAAPGDTVTVRLFCYIPPAESPAIHWQVALDYGNDIYGAEYSRRKVSLDSLMLPGGRPDNFQFVVPESALLYSSETSLLLQDTVYNSNRYSVAAIDSILKQAAPSREIPAAALLPPPLDQMPDLPELVVDNIACRLQVIAQLRAGISLDVTKLLRVRYSRSFNTSNINKNPVINWMGIVAVRRPNLFGPDSIGMFGYTIQYLYYPGHPSSVADTVIIDSGISYFAAADTSGPGDNMQKYHYFSLKDQVVKIDSEQLSFDWFYTNEDFAEGMVADSLILLMPRGPVSAMERLLTPVDTAMHRFTLHTMARDVRWNDFLCTTGADFVSASGYFVYTPAYVRNMHHKPAAVTVGN